MRLDLIRHGDTGRRGYLDGRTDVPLSPEGWRRLELQAQGIGPCTVVTSHLKRAQVFAADLALRWGASLVVDADWAEFDFGAWDGRRLSEIADEGDGDARLAAFYSDPVSARPPDGEHWSDFEARVSRAVDRACEKAQDNNVLVIAHGGPMRCALTKLLGVPFAPTWAFRIDYGTRLSFDVGRGADGATWASLIEMRQVP